MSLSIEYDVAVIGAGAVGLSTSYNLATKGMRVVVIEKNYAGSGSSTRNAAGFRVHFNSEHNVKFMVEGRKRLVNFGKKMGWNPIIFETGYLWLLSTEAEIQQFKRLNTMWSSHAAGGRFLEPHEIRDIVPDLDLQGVLGGFYGPQDGTFHHDPILFGYQEKLADMGVHLLEYSPISGFNVASDKVRSAFVGSKEIKADKFVVCAGAWTPQVTALLGVNVPITPERRELGVTEPVKNFIKPFVISLANKVYFAQGLRGEIRGGVTDMFKEGYHPLVSTLEWTIAYSTRLVKTLPSVSNIRLNRQWSGYYEVTPDHSQIMGSHHSWPENLYVAAGFSGHGMMMSPLAGELMAELIATNRVPELMRPYSPVRFDENKLIDEAMVF
ncbi:MAG: FAD-binding oxidoreductase [Thermoprotei archaeon]